MTPRRMLIAGACLIPFSAAAAPLTITTVENPPLSYMDPNTREVTGIVTEVVKQVLAKAGVEYRIEILPWQRAYKMGLEELNTCVYATVVTDERKPLFKWVAPIATDNWVLYGAPDSTIALKTLEDAKSYKIGGYQGDAKTVYLTAQGYTLDATSQDSLNVNKLTAHRIDLWVTSERAGPALAERQGVTNLKKLLVFKEVVMGLACNKETPDDVIAKLNEALRQVPVAK
jgi:polar amino acid transport system substrate-binding protein